MALYRLRCDGMAASIVKRPPPYSTIRSALEREVRVETYRAGGPGGQHRNVTESAVRLVHGPSGVRVVSADSRSQIRNLERAFERLVEKLTKLNRVPMRRVATRIPKGDRERRLQEKQRRQSTKSLRGAVHHDE